MKYTCLLVQLLKSDFIFRCNSFQVFSDGYLIFGNIYLCIHLKTLFSPKQMHITSFHSHNIKMTHPDHCDVLLLTIPTLLASVITSNPEFLIHPSPGSQLKGMLPTSPFSCLSGTVVLIMSDKCVCVFRRLPTMT